MSRHLVVTNTLYQLISKAIGVTVSLTLTIVISRSLGVAEFGQLVKIITFVGLFYMPLDFGINAVTLRLFSKHPSKQSTITQNLLTLRSGLASLLFLVSAVAVTILSLTHPDSYAGTIHTGILLLSLTIFAHAAIKTTNAVFQYHLTYQNLILADLAQGASALASLVIAITYTHSILTIVWGYIIGGILAAASQLYLARNNFRLPYSISWTQIKRLLLPALPLGLTLIISTLNSKLDILSLSFLTDNYNLGTYGLAKRIHELVLVVPIFATNAVYPLFLKHTEKLAKATTQTALGLTALSIFAAAGLIIAAPLLTIIKPDFAASIAYLRLLVLSLPFFFASTPIMWSLIAKHRETTLIPIYSIGLLTNILSNLILSPVYGPAGAIASLTLAEAVILLLLFIANKKHQAPSSKKQTNSKY